jgi:hypothetical protein
VTEFKFISAAAFRLDRGELGVCTVMQAIANGLSGGQ